MRGSLTDEVFRKLKKVPEGRVTTYKWLAEAVETRGYRVVGQILKRNTNAPRIPCHRVVFSNGLVGGFMGKRKGEAIMKKIELLQTEGVIVAKGRVELERFGYDFRDQK